METNHPVRRYHSDSLSSPDSQLSPSLGVAAFLSLLALAGLVYCNANLDESPQKNSRESQLFIFATVALAGALGAEVQTLSRIQQNRRVDSRGRRPLPAVMSAAGGASVTTLAYLLYRAALHQIRAGASPDPAAISAVAAVFGLFTEQSLALAGATATAIEDAATRAIQAFVRDTTENPPAEASHLVDSSECGEVIDTRSECDEPSLCTVARESATSLSLCAQSAAIIAACDTDWSASSHENARFVQKVFDRLGIQDLRNGHAIDADQVLETLASSALWSELPRGDDEAAKLKADQGLLVIAGLTAEDCGGSNGHLFVVVSGPLDRAHGRYPTAYWGRSPKSQAGRFQTVNHACFASQPGQHPIVNRIRYFARVLPDRPLGVV